MPKFTIDQNGTAIDASGKAIGQRGPDGRLRMFPTEELPVAAEMASKVAEMKRVSEEPPAEAAAPQFPRESAVVPVRPGTRQDSPAAPEPARPASAGPAPVSYTKYEVRPDSFFTVRFCLGFKEERVLVYTEDAKYKLPDLESHWATFRMWTFREELEWRNRTTIYDQPSRSWRPDPGKLNEIKLRNLLHDWSFAETDPKFRLFHVNGVLADESYNLVMGLFPSILDNLLYLMNNILENNG